MTREEKRVQEDWKATCQERQCVDGVRSTILRVPTRRKVSRCDIHTTDALSHLTFIGKVGSPPRQ